MIIQFSSVQSLSRVRLCNPMDYSTPGLPVHHQLLEFAQTHVHWVSDAIQPSHPLSSPSPSALNLSQHQGLFQWVGSLHQVAKALSSNLSQHQGLFQWVGSSHQVAKVLELRHQYHSFQWIFRVEFPLGLSHLISLQSKGLSRVFSNTRFQKHQVFSAQLSL